MKNRASFLIKKFSRAAAAKRIMEKQIYSKKANCHFCARPSIGHNSAIFHSILIFNILKMLVFSRQIEWWKNQSFISFVLDFDFWPNFCSEASHGQHCAHGPKTTLKRLGCVLAYPFNSYLKIEVSKIRSLNPP